MEDGGVFVLIILTAVVLILIGAMLGADNQRIGDAQKIIYCSDLQLPAEKCADWVMSNKEAEDYFAEKK